MRLGPVIGEGSPQGYGVIRYAARNLPGPRERRGILGTQATVTVGDDAGATGIVTLINYKDGYVDLMQPEAYKAYFRARPVR